ncbi:MAG TPA: tetratricopeptide repeat protein [Rhizomicrobium sp.]|nr:tetratricopeptide repeat protein [Rhizomicrobium sp.]
MTIPNAQALLVAGKPNEALSAFDQLLAARPGETQALFGRATALKMLGRLSEARAGYDTVLARMPTAPGALYNRGEVLNALGLHEDALADFDRALAIKPDFANAVLGRGIALQRLYRTGEALACFERTLHLWPDCVDAFFFRGLALAEIGYPEEAIENYSKAIALHPGNFAAINNRSVSLIGLRRFAEAAKGYEILDKMDPGNAAALTGLAGAALHACDWSRRDEFADKIAAVIAAGKSGIQPGTALGYIDDPALLLACAKSLVAGLPAGPGPLWKHQPFSGKKIKLAYSSANFCSHAMPRLMAGVFERHDRSRFEVIAISFGVDDGSPIRARLTRAFDQFHDVRFSSARQIAELMVRLEVDIAVDLMGFTEQSRLGIFALRPAPVQANYIGYPGTLGADFYDAIIADAIVAPLEQQPYFSETIVPLVDTYWPTDDRRAEAGPPPGRADAGLPGQGFVFCCFNNNWKITPPLFDIWMRLLKAVPDSVLWLLQDSAEAADNLGREARARGVAAERLVFAPRVSPEDHLARHRLAGLFLDTLPYNAHTTASDALWVGVPLVTCKGACFHGRVAASILSAIGLPELIAENLDDYESLALALATDAPRLAALKRKLEENRKTTPLFDTARFTRAMEAGYEKMRSAFLT